MACQSEERDVTNPFPALFQPAAFGPLTLRNRLVMAPMTREFSPGGVPGADVAEYYRRRAEGGVGLIVTEGTLIDHPAANAYSDRVPRFHGNDALNGWKGVVDAVHAVGGHIIPQIWHTGAVREPGASGSELPGYGPMELRAEDGTLRCQAMSPADIEAVVNAYGTAAAQAERLGFDGVEIHGAHGYLVDQFIRESSNARGDAYGGSLDRRLRFALEVVAAVRANVRPEFPVVFRFSQWKSGDYAARIANDPGHLARLLEPLSAAGVDVFHASTRRFWEPAFEGSGRTLAAWTRHITGKPVIAVGGLGLDDKPGPGLPADAPSLRHLEEGFARGDFDFIAAGRALLADAGWGNKLADGRLGEIIRFDPSQLETLD
jgi:2,4-dienoyl-CoA reductase-like NADH-dependent reductase (Old Yellow Enzyme family)